jgi:hypothetical protein
MDAIDGPAMRAWEDYHDQMKIRYGKITRGSRTQYFSDRRRKTFRRIAELCAKHRVDVTDFMLRTFDLLDLERGQYITPSDFLTEGIAMRTYLEQRDSFGSDAVSSWTTQDNMFTEMSCRMIPSFYETEEALLYSVNTPICEWYRIFHPHVESERIFKKYGRVVWGELQKDRKLREFLQKQNPARYKMLELRWGNFEDTMVEGARNDEPIYT